jgi:hypothetical protein
MNGNFTVTSPGNSRLVVTSGSLSDFNTEPEPDCGATPHCGAIRFLNPTDSHSSKKSPS